MRSITAMCLIVLLGAGCNCNGPTTNDGGMGGGTSGNEQILVSSATDGTFTNGSQAFCISSASAGSFAVPPYVLLALPAGNFAGVQLSPAQVSVPFTATGLSVGLLQTQIDGVGPGLTLR